MEEEVQLMAMMPQLPEEILICILSRLPVETLLRFRCVSKGWRTLISDPNFITQHLNRSAENYPRLILGQLQNYEIFNINYETSSEVLRYDFSKFSPGFSLLEIVGSSNGLACLSFADASSNDCKVVSIDYYLKYGRLGKTIYHSEVKVYSLNTGLWRRVEDASFIISLGRKIKLTNAVVNGAIHWMGNYGNFRSEFIISFDLGLEKFREIPEHEYRHGGISFSKTLGVLGGCLSVFDVYGDQCIEIWVMKDYGVKDSWTKLFTIDALPNITASVPFKSILPITIRKNGEVLMEIGIELVSYDPKSGRQSVIGPGGLSTCFESFTYVESLVSLKVGYGQEGEP
ncbi:F-box/kelch-repeat protein At3g06240-like [Telopea speciosissima]|uniref:F-box/kelch-repeat protein At3g06240-like n=1 Tax=Telopea speciosissima TaxID=54955 RepID=UPI001CC72C2E|nr:F-box/kelch-repeat protein At3g06240-like [Telopea speciosissima]